MIRIESGIKGFDKLINGGFPSGSCTLLKGAAGTGKTIFALQFCYHGSAKNEPSIFCSLVQREEELIEQARQFGWKIPAKNLSLLCIDPKQGAAPIFENIVKEVKRIGAKRLVVDSLSSLVAYTTLASRKIVGPSAVFLKEIEPIVSRKPNKVVLRMVTDMIVGELKRLGCTTLLTSEGLEEDIASEYACDGIIALSADVVGKVLERTVRVIKMRETKIDGGIYSFEIGPNGPRVLTK
ncbi:MAG: ATPase domain-containing protein [Candidatus Aenigmatarchaeota archaeon]